MVRISLGPRGQAVLILALVATLGALVGIMADRVLARRGAAATPSTVERTREPRGAMVPGMRYGEGLATRLDLSTAQRASIDSILAEDRLRARELTRQFQPQFRSLAEETRARVEAVLTPEQRAELRVMRQQRMRRGEMRPGGIRPGDLRPGDLRPGMRPDGPRSGMHPDSQPLDSMPRP
jgi:Spy/CpxP family protein refolding chaperone